MILARCRKHVFNFRHGGFTNTFFFTNAHASAHSRLDHHIVSMHARTPRTHAHTHTHSHTHAGTYARWRTHIVLFQTCKKIMIKGPIYKYHSAYLFLFDRQSWKSKNYNEATTESFVTANVVIDGNGKGRMSTRSYGTCGKEGLFIRIPKTYLTLSGYIAPGIVVFYVEGNKRCLFKAVGK